MSKSKTRGAEAEAAREDMLLRAQLEAFDARREAAEQEHRQFMQGVQQMLADERNQRAKDKLEAEAASLDAYKAEVIAQALSSKAVAPQFADYIQGTSREEIDRSAALARAKTAELGIGQPVTSVPAQPRDAQGRWLPQQPAEPAPQEPAEADYATMSMQEYAAARARLGIDRRGLNNLGRAPGHERQEFMGHTLDEGSGFADWRQYAANERVYESQLGGRRAVPPGYVRRSAEESDQWR